MTRLVISTGRTSSQRLTPADVVAQLGSDAFELAGQMASPARSHQESEARSAEGERIAAAMRRVFRG